MLKPKLFRPNIAYSAKLEVAAWSSCTFLFCGFITLQFQQNNLCQTKMSELEFYLKAGVCWVSCEMLPCVSIRCQGRPVCFAFSEYTHLGQNYTFSQVSETTDQLKSSLVTINRVPLPTCSIATVSYWIQNGLSFFLSHELVCMSSFLWGRRDLKKSCTRKRSNNMQSTMSDGKYEFLKNFSGMFAIISASHGCRTARQF